MSESGQRLIKAAKEAAALATEGLTVERTILIEDVTACTDAMLLDCAQLAALPRAVLEHAVCMGLYETRAAAPTPSQPSPVRLQTDDEMLASICGKPSPATPSLVELLRAGPGPTEDWPLEALMFDAATALEMAEREKGHWQAMTNLNYFQLQEALEQITTLKTALETIRDSFWTENEPFEDRVDCLQRIAADTLASKDQGNG